MIVLSRSSKAYRERAGLTPTRRGPTPSFCPADNLAASVFVAPPLPEPGYLGNTQGNPPPDRGLSTVWPPGAAAGP
jgi:hypothetical protein